MADPPGSLLSLHDVERDYHGLRPLRVRALDVRLGDAIAILGMDREAAEAFVNLASAATLPDKGVVWTLGQPTSAVTSSDQWNELLERVGILSERSVLLGEMTVEQNLAMPYSLDLFELSSELRARVEALAREVGLPADVLKTPAAGLSMLMRARLRLARAIAAEPQVLLAEHPNALVEESVVKAFGEDIARVVAGRRMAAVVVTADRSFAKVVARTLLVHNPATGELTPASLWRRWLSG
jgi:ABC-type lipoprotein export system ATPase subunit